MPVFICTLFYEILDSSLRFYSVLYGLTEVLSPRFAKVLVRVRISNQYSRHVECW